MDESDWSSDDMALVVISVAGDGKSMNGDGCSVNDRCVCYQWCSLDKNWRRMCDQLMRCLDDRMSSNQRSSSDDLVLNNWRNVNDRNCLVVNLRSVAARWARRYRHRVHCNCRCSRDNCRSDHEISRSSRNASHEGNKYYEFEHFSFTFFSTRSFFKKFKLYSRLWLLVKTVLDRMILFHQYPTVYISSSWPSYIKKYRTWFLYR